MNIRLILVILFALLLLFASFTAYGFGIPMIHLTCTRSAVLDDGKDYAEIIAEPIDSTGSPMPDGTEVTFTTNLGTFSPSAVVRVQGGAARVRISSTQVGDATVQAIIPGGGLAKTDIIFTNNPADTVQGNMYVTIESKGALIYSASDRVVQAIGKLEHHYDTTLPNAVLSYRNIEIFADTLQLDCNTNTVKTQGRTIIRKGKDRLECDKLIFPLMSGDGYAITEVDGHLKPVEIRALDLKILKKPVTYSPAFYQLMDISNAKLLVTCSQIVYFPGQKLQFKHPKFYQDGQPLLSMSYYSLPLYSNQLFTDQFVSVGSQGVSMNIPVYYDLTPDTMGVFRITHAEAAGDSLYATEPGWSMDVTQSYNSPGVDQRYSGQFGLTGITRTDWGADWSHSQEFDSNTRGSFFLSLPQHRSILGSMNLSHQLGSLYSGLSISENQSISGIPTNSFDGQVYLQTNPIKVGSSGYSMSLGTTTTNTHSNSFGFVSNGTSEDVHLQFNSSQFHLGKSTTLNNSISVGNSWVQGSYGTGGLSILGTVGLNQQITQFANMQLTYDYSRQTYQLGGGSHRLSLNLMASMGSKWNFYLYNTLLLDATSSSTTADFNYQLAPRWSLMLTSTLETFSGSQYRDYDIGVARTILGRDLLVTYSTFNHRMFFSLQAARF